MGQEGKYEWWFANIYPLETRKKRLLLEAAGSAEAIYYMEEKRLNEMRFLTEKEKGLIREAIKMPQIDRDYENFRKQGITFIPYDDARYPKRLKEIEAPPYALYIKGTLPAENQPAAAIVGTRRCSPYGEQMALTFAAALAEAGCQIISGMARGIDAAGQRGALNAGGHSYGVLGCGVDICYPRENRGLYQDLQEKGGILSEYPPGTPPLKHHFPARNRIISGLSDFVLVMEAGERSGSFITADFALEQGKDVYALPGPVTGKLSRGCHELIRQGAGILLSPQELLRELNISRVNGKGGAGQETDKNEKMLESAENLVYSKLDLYPKSLSSLMDETGLSASALIQQLVSLVMKGYAKEVSRNYYRKAGI